MPELYRLNEIDGTTCPDCGTEMILLSLREGIHVGCPECIPDGLVESYGSIEYRSARSDLYDG